MILDPRNWSSCTVQTTGLFATICAGNTLHNLAHLRSSIGSMQAWYSPDFLTGAVLAPTTPQEQHA